MTWLTNILNNKFFTTALVLLASLLLIFYKFNQIPGYISFDEIEFGQLALSLDHHPYIPYSPLATGHSTLYFYIILLSMKIFGVGNFALRLPAAIFGVLSVFIFHQLLRKLTKYEWLALVSTLVFVTLRWYFNFARFSFEATFLLFLELCSLYFLFAFFKKKTTLNLVLTAIFAGLAFHSYYPGKIFFLIPAIFIFLRSQKKYFWIFLLVFFLLIAPLLFYTRTVKDIRVQQQLYLLDKKIGMTTKTAYFLGNIAKTAEMFVFKGDMNGRHNYTGKPALNPIFGLLFIAGFVLMVKNIRELNNQIFLSYFVLSLIPTLFTLPFDNPNMLRTFTALPTVVYSIFYLINYLRGKKLRIPKQYILLSIFFLLLISAVYELRTYFVFQSRVFRNAFEIKCPLEKVIRYQRTTIPLNCRVRKNEY